MATMILYFALIKQYLLKNLPHHFRSAKQGGSIISQTSCSSPLHYSYS
jgi:hypothetical protein